MQGSAPVTSLSETSSESEDSIVKLNDKDDVVDLSKMERAFITGVLDELKVCFSYSYQVSLNYILDKKLPCKRRSDRAVFL